jgi:uncharacterized membrane protein
MSERHDHIKNILSSKDDELLERQLSEPGYAKQTAGLFGGKWGWIMSLIGISQLVLLLAAIYTLHGMVRTDEVTSVVRYGVGGIVMIQAATLLRSFMGLQFETNRILRELARVELRLVLLEEGLSRSD